MALHFWMHPPTRDLCFSYRGVCWIWWEPAHLWERRQRKGHQPSQRKIWLQDGGNDWRRSHWSGGVSPCCEFPLYTLFKLSCVLCIQLCFVMVMQLLVCRRWKIYLCFNLIVVNLLKLTGASLAKRTNSTCNEAVMEQHYLYKVVAQYVWSTISMLKFLEKSLCWHVI